MRRRDSPRRSRHPEPHVPRRSNPRPADLVRKQVITYEVSNQTRSDIYSEFLLLANSGIRSEPDAMRRSVRGSCLSDRQGPDGRIAPDVCSPSTHELKGLPGVWGLYAARKEGLTSLDRQAAG